MFQKAHSLIQNEKTSLKDSQNKFCVSIGKLIPIIEYDSKALSYSVEDQMNFFHEVFESLKLPKLSKNFSTSIKEIFLSISSELMGDSFKRGKHCRKAFSNMLEFLVFCMEKVKWIKEFQQILKNHKKSTLQKTSKKVPELSNKLENLLSGKLSLLAKIIKDFYESKQLFENSLCSQKKLKLLSVIEMLTLDSHTILGCVPNLLTHNAFFLDHDYVLINGKNLRNHLAHGNALFSILLGDDSTNIILNAEEMIRHDLRKSERQIGKKVKNDPQRSKVTYDRELSAVDEQLELFIALSKGKIERVKDCLKKGADLLGRDMRSQTSLHFAAKGSCLEMVKFVSKFNLEISAIDVHLQTALHVASMNGMLTIVEYLIQERNASINNRDINGKTPLHLASFNGHADVVKCLIKHGAKLEVKDLSGRTALHHAVTQNHNDIVNILLEKESNYGSNKTRSGYSALHLASDMGHINLVVTLLEKINVNFKSDLYIIPLHFAARGGHAGVVRFLITKGADINAKTAHGLTPLHMAVDEGHYEVVDILLHHGADINVVDINGFTPLSFAAKRGFLTISKLLLEKDVAFKSSESSTISPIFRAAYYGHHDLVHILVHKCDTGTKVLTLHWAAFAGRLSIVKLLMNNEINVLCDNNGCTALHLAAFSGHTDVVNFLISMGYDINAKVSRNEFEENFTYKDSLDDLELFCDSNMEFKILLQFLSGKTALHISSLKRHKDTVRSLLKNRANIYITDDMGRTSLEIIIREGMAKILVEENVSFNSSFCDNYSPLQLGAAEGEISLVKYCIQENCDINAASRLEDLTALDLAILRGHAEVVSYLIDWGADVNAARRDGTTALDRAVMVNRKDILRILISKNAEISAKKEREYFMSAVISGHENIVEYFLTVNPANGFSRPECQEFPLHDAVCFGHLIIVKMLLDLKDRKDINEKDKRAKTPLQMASDKGYCEITQLLLSNGADPNMSDPSPPLHLAIENGDSEMVEILINAGANISLRDSKGYHAIELAIKRKNLEIMETLLEFSNIDINLKGHNGSTLLHDAVSSGSLQIVKGLVDKGGLINCRDSSGAKPIHIAATKGYQDIIEYFLSQGLDIEERGLLNFWSLMHYAAARNQSAICKFLIKNGQDVNIYDESGCTPLHIAAKMNKVDVLHDLLNYGAYYDFRNEKNETPFDAARSTHSTTSFSVLLTLTFISSLFSAVQKNHIPKVEALLKEGMRFSEYGYANVKNEKNISLLHYAAWKGSEDIVSLLLKYNADPNVRTANGSTPLHYAAKFSHRRIVNILLSNGANFEAVCNSEKTPVNYATDQSIIKILDFLKELFLKIRNCENFIDSLNVLGNLDAAKTVMRAKNSCGRTLITFAVIKEHPEVEKLISLFQPDITIRCCITYKLSEEGKIEESLQQFKTILEERIGVFGDEDPVVLEIQELMSNVLIKLKKYDEAQILAERIYRVRKEMFGVCNKETLSAMELVASILVFKGRKKEAITVFEEVLNKKRERLGSDNPETLKSQILLAHFINEEETESGIFKALKLCLETLEELKKFPERMPSILEIKILASRLLRTLGNASEALDIFKNIFEIQKEMFGLYHSETSDTLFEIALTLFHMGEEDTLKVFKDTLEIQHRILGPNNEKTLKSRYWLANTLYSDLLYLESLEIYKADLESRTSILGTNHPEILDTHQKIDYILSDVLKKKHNPEYIGK